MTRFWDGRTDGQTDGRSDYTPRPAFAFGDAGEKLRSHLYFDFRDHCLFCGFPAEVNGKKRGNDVYFVKTFDFQKTIEKNCEEEMTAGVVKLRGD